MSINNFVVSGYVGADPTTFTIKNGENAGEVAASFSLGEQVGEDKTVWHQVSVYGKKVDTILNHVKKGTKLTVTGRASSTAFLNKDQKLVSCINIAMRDFDFASKLEKEGDDALEVPPAEIQQLSEN